MELHGEVSINAPRPRVWAALNDPAVLARCIDGVETLTRTATDGGERFEGRMNARVGPVRASFAGHVALTEVNAPESYVLVGEGKGGIAGFAKGDAKVTLIEPSAGVTLLAYHVTSSVGGKLAQLGARLIEGAAKGYADTFFTRLKAEVETPMVDALEASSGAAQIPSVEDITDSLIAPDAVIIPGVIPATGLAPFVWGGGLILAVLAFLLWQWG